MRKSTDRIAAFAAACACAFACAIFAGGAQGEASGGAPRRAGPLAGLPSPAGEHCRRVEALGDKQWLPLGKPAPDPRWGSARGRSWTAKMAYAPDLRAALLCGEGVHGWWNRDTGRYMDDLWAYDTFAHRWICVYPGADVRRLELKLNEEGFETTADGEALPVAQLGHGYEMTAYDSDLLRLLFVPCDANYWEVMRERRNRWLKGRDQLKLQGSPGPWFYDTAGGRWGRRLTGGPGPRTSFGDVLVYDAPRRRTFLRDAAFDVWFHDTAKNAWAKAAPKGPPPPFGIDPVACLDTKRDRIYMGGGNYPVSPGPHALWCYDLRADAWIDLEPKGKPCKGSNHYGTNVATMTYDAANDIVVLSFREGGHGAQGIYAYDPAANAWTAEPLPFPEGARWKQVNGFYDPVLNAHFYHSAGDSVDDGEIWAFRWGRGRPGG